MQKVFDPVPRIRHPDRLHRRVTALEDRFRQHKVTDFSKMMAVDAGDKTQPSESVPMDTEDFGDSNR